MKQKSVRLLLLEQPKSQSKQMPLKETTIISTETVQASTRSVGKRLLDYRPYQMGTVKQRSLPKQLSMRRPREIIHAVKPRPQASPQRAIDEMGTMPKPRPHRPVVKREQQQVSDRRLPRSVQSPSSERIAIPSAAEKHEYSNAAIVQEVKYNALYHCVAHYMADQSKKIGLMWNLEVFHSGSVVRKGTKTTIAVKILPSGVIACKEVLFHDGQEWELSNPLVAIEKCSPLAPLTPEVLNILRTDGLWVVINFHYG